MNNSLRYRANGQEGSNMKTYYKDYGCTASITDMPDGTARLIVKNQYGKTIKDSTHKSRKAAYSAWRKLCN